MGNWVTTIHGHGIHDNGREDDAERLIADFVRSLQEKGHVIHQVHFTVGSDRELLTQDGEWKFAS